MTDEQFSERYMSQLNEQQREAVRATDGAVLLLAVPGSGKTTVLVTRLGYMAAVAGIDPTTILTMTYTRAATKEMRTRCAGLFAENLARKVTFGTINAVSLDIVRYYSRNHGKAEMFGLVEEGNANRIVGEIYRELTKEFPTESNIKDIRTGITYAKNMMMSPDELETMETNVEHFPEIFARYNAELRRRCLMDFDDQMVYAFKILRSYPAVLAHYQERYRYLCVDESQDTSKIQHGIIWLLAGKYRNVFMVGDEDQSIYGFRAAYPEALMRFQKDYPGARVLLMERNYRSTQAIVNAANAFVARNADRYKKTMQTSRSAGAKVRVVEVKSREQQFQYLFKAAQKSQKETAVLYRNNDSALPLIDLLERSGIPYACRNFDSTFFNHRVVSDISDIIRFAGEPGNVELFQRIYYKFNVPIPKAAALYACAQGEKTGRPLLDSLLDAPELSDYGRNCAQELAFHMDALKKDGGEAAINRIWYGMGYGRFVQQRKLDEGKRPILTLLGRQEKSAVSLLERLDVLREIILTRQNTEDAKLLLSTIHSSKGLEYRQVYLLDVLDGILPSLTEAEAMTPEEWRAYQEERRIFYVGMTRAKDQLCLFRCAGERSEFVSEVMRSLPAEEKKAAPGKGASFTRLRKGMKIRHRKLGNGVVTDLDPARDRLGITFNESGEEKYFGLRATLDRGLLERI